MNPRLETALDSAAAIVLFFVVFSLPACTREPAVAPPEEKGYLYIGLVAPRSGPLVAVGDGLVQGAEMAVKEANDSSETRARPIRLLFEDEAAPLPAKKRLASDPRVPLLVGHVLERKLERSRGLYVKAGRPVLLPVLASSQAPALGEGLFFRIMASEASQAEALARFAREKRSAKSALIVHEDSRTGRLMAAAFNRVFSAEAQVRVETALYQAEQKEALALAGRAADFKPDVVFLALQTQPAIHLTQTFSEAGVKTVFLGTSTLAVSDAVAWLGRLPHFTYVCLPFNPEETGEAWQAFVQRYKRRHHRPPDWPGVAAYDAVKLAVKALDQAGDKPEAVRDYLNKLTGPPHIHHGLAGDYYFPSAGQGVGPVFVVQVKAALLGLVP
ncbi:MAG: ABC transporter substrate-binding protein [Thermodesulfobacteriota bacterium]